MSRSSEDAAATFKTTLQQAVRDAGFINQADLETKTGLSHSTISAAFSLTQPLPSAKTVHMIATAMRASTEQWERRRRDAAPTVTSTDVDADSEIHDGDTYPVHAGTGLHDTSDARAQHELALESARDQKADAQDGGITLPLRPDRRRHLLGLTLATCVVAIAVAAVVLMVSLRRNSHHDDRLPAHLYTETTGTPAHTWSDYMQAMGTAGTPLGPRQSILVSCRVRGYVVPDGDPWWYRIESPPWNGHFYASSDAFYNEGSISGPVDTGVVVDEQVPVCSDT